MKARGRRECVQRKTWRGRLLHSAAMSMVNGGPVTSASTQTDAVWETSRGITSSCVSVEKLYQIEKCGGTAPMIKCCNTSEDRSTQVTLWYVSVIYHLIRNIKTKVSLDTTLSLALVAWGLQPLWYLLGKHTSWCKQSGRFLGCVVKKLSCS